MQIINPIYKPKNAAGEYCEYALNIYTECPHGCWYCYARDMAKRFGNTWTGNIKTREGIIEAVEKQLTKGVFENKLIHLCFTCDPYPQGYDTSITRKIINVIKDSGNNVQILTKNPTVRDFDLLDEDDWFGITLTGVENTNIRNKDNVKINILKQAWNVGINTWISFEPILNPEKVLEYIKTLWWVDKMAVGKLNYQRSDINWKTFGIEAEKLLKQRKREYIIKESLRKEIGT